MARIEDAQLPDDMGAMLQNNLHRALFNSRDVAERFCGLARGVHTASTLPHRIRELAILRVAATLRAEVEWAQHFKIAQMVGVSVDEARAIRDGDLSAFTPAEVAAIRFAEATDKCGVSDQLWRATAEHFSEGQMLDLVMLAGFYGYASRATMALAVDVDEGLTRIDES